MNLASKHLFSALAMTATLCLCAGSTQAQNRVVLDLKLTDTQALGQVTGPARIAGGGKHDLELERQGRPRYMNVPHDASLGRALLFDGKSSYRREGALPAMPTGYVLEAWCRATAGTRPGLHGVVAMGDGARGCSLVQRDGEWGVFVGGTGFIAAGRVQAGAWTHLALVMPAKGTGTLYLDGGKKQDGVPRSANRTPLFTVGDMGHGKEFFGGDISRVRLSTLGARAFSARTDLLVNPARVEHVHRESQQETRRRLQAILGELPKIASTPIPEFESDWLVQACTQPSQLQVTVAKDGLSAQLVLGNGLVRRSFYLSHNLVCYSYARGKQEFLRSIKPEATLTIDGRTVPVGGLRFPSMASGHKGRARSPYVGNYFLESWLPELLNDPGALVLTRVRTSAPKPDLRWKPLEGKTGLPWPPKGIVLDMTYSAPASLPKLQGLQVTVHYAIYDGIPTIGKWLSFAWKGEGTVQLDRTLIEELAIADEQGNRMFVESELNYFHATPTRWCVDPEFKTDAGPIYTERMSDYRLRYWSQKELEEASTRFDRRPEWQGEYRSRSLMRVQYPEGPAKILEKGGSWQTFRAWTLLQDSMDEERKGLARRKLYRTLFPWTSENLVYMHVLSHKSDAIRKAADQCAACGFDMLILTFGSGFNMMSKDPAYRARIKKDFAYAHGLGIKVGAYIHFCSGRSYGNGEHDAKSPNGGRNLCLGSSFTDGYFEQLLDFMTESGMDCLETDGPYHGYPCSDKTHAHHRGLEDSWRVGWEQQVRFYHECMERDIYIIAPDWYYASGNRKAPMGYRESNWTLPRAQQALVARQNIYDATWWRTPSMSYHALPLTSVYGGGPDSTMEPLSEHLDAYDRVLGAYFGTGIMACYRGFRLYDTEATRKVVTGWVQFYRKHQAILDSDIIHVRRPDGRDLDCMLHANPELTEKGLAVIWNPTDKPIQRDFTLPLYYTGIKHKASIALHRGYTEEGKAKTYPLDRDYRVRVPVTVPAQGYVWLLIKDAE